MSQLKSLTAFITEAVPPSVMAGFDSRMDEIQLIPAHRDNGLGQYRLAIIRYKAVLTWARFPCQEYDPTFLMALLLSWLSQEERSVFEEIGIDSERPGFDIDPIDSEAAKVALTLPMAEELNLVPDEQGPIPFDGQRWKLADPDIWTATEADFLPVAANVDSV
jgi:hypothetical protein